MDESYSSLAEKLADVNRRINAALRGKYTPPQEPPATAPPIVALTAPTTGFTASAPASILMTATATAFDGTPVDSVDFYLGTTLVRHVLSATRLNYALQANGGIASATSSYSANYPVVGAVNGDRNGIGWGAGGGWNSAAAPSVASPQDYFVQLGTASEDVDEINVFTLQDGEAKLVPTLAMTQSQDGLRDFVIAYSTNGGSSYTTVASVTDNNKVWYQNLPVSPIPAGALVRLRVTKAYTTHGDYARLVEFELVGNGDALSTSFSATAVNVAAGDYDLTAVAVKGALSSTSAPIRVTVTQPAAPPPPPPSTGAPSTRVQVASDFLDGANATWANTCLLTLWDHKFGDYLDANGTPQGANHYAQINVGPGEQDLRIDLPAALINAQRVDNTGMLVMRLVGNEMGFSSKENTSGKPIPKLFVTMSDGTVITPTLLHDIWLADRTTCAGLEAAIITPLILKFDMNQINGTVASAYIVLHVISGSPTTTLAVNYLNMPELITDPAKQIGGVETGLRGAYASEAAFVAAAPAAVKDYLVQDPNITPGQWDLYYPFRFSHDGFKTWTEYGVGAQRLTTLGGERPGGDPNDPNPFPVLNPASWRRAIPAARVYYINYSFLIDASVRAGYNPGNTGHKLPGLIYDLIDVTGTPDVFFSMRLLHGKASPSHPGIYRFQTEFYTADHPSSIHGAEEVPAARSCFQDSTVQNIEMMLDIGDVGLSNGRVTLWHWGVKVYDRPGMNICGSNPLAIINQIFASIYCGGGEMPLAQMYYELGPIVLATSYIGPPKRVTAQWLQGRVRHVPIEIPGTTYAAANIAGAAGPDAYSTVSYMRGKLVAVGVGGHNDGNQGRNPYLSNDITKDAPGWVREWDGTPLDQIPPTYQVAAAIGAHHYLNGDPPSNHHYYGQVFVEQMNRIAVMALFRYWSDPPASWGQPQTFDPSAKAWDIQGDWNPRDRTQWLAGGSGWTKRPGAHPDWPGVPAAGDNTTLAIDTRTGDIYCGTSVGAWGIVKFTRTGSTWVCNGVLPNTFNASNRVALGVGMFFDVIRNCLVIQSKGFDGEGTAAATWGPEKRYARYSLTTLNWLPTVTITGLNTEPNFGVNGGACHDTDADEYIFMSGTQSAGVGRVYGATPVAPTATEAPGNIILGTTQDRSPNLFGAMGYAPVSDNNLGGIWMFRKPDTPPLFIPRIV